MRHILKLENFQNLINPKHNQLTVTLHDVITDTQNVNEGPGDGHLSIGAPLADLEEGPFCWGLRETGLRRLQK
jgi:hypothetical protein